MFYIDQQEEIEDLNAEKNNLNLKNMSPVQAERVCVLRNLDYRQNLKKTE